MKDTRSIFKLYSAAAKRLVMVNCFSRTLNLVNLIEFPKSGATWFGQMLSEASGIPFPRNTTPVFGQNIMHGHYLFRPQMHKAIHVLRDGRDVMVSAYFHFLFDNSHNHPNLVKYTRKKLLFDDYDAIKENLPYFIEYMFTAYANKSFLHFSWADAINNIKENKANILVIKYEDLLVDPVGCLKAALDYYDIKSPGEERLIEIVDNYSFKKITNRNPGEEDKRSFIRKGIKGDWNNYFTEQACDVFKSFAGKELVEIGYEKDNSWHSCLL